MATNLFFFLDGPNLVNITPSSGTLKVKRLRDGPFNLKRGDYGFFSKKNVLIPNVAEKNILILVEEKKM
jgi:hypothetical protein